MKLQEFHNALRVMLNLDLPDLQKWGAFKDAKDWPKFQENPWRYFIKADDATADRIWLAMSERMAP